MAHLSVQIVLVFPLDFVNSLDILFDGAYLLVVLEDLLLKIIILLLPLVLHLLWNVHYLRNLNVDLSFHH